MTRRRRRGSGGMVDECVFEERRRRGNAGWIWKLSSACCLHSLSEMFSCNSRAFIGSLFGYLSPLHLEMVLWKERLQTHEFDRFFRQLD